MKSVGTFILSKSTQRFLFGLRSKKSSYPLTWGIFGGKILKHESKLQGLERELFEEIGNNYNILKIIPCDFYQNLEKQFEYMSYLMIVEEEFIPKLNKEHLGYCWVKLDNWNNLKFHPSVKKTLKYSLLLDSFKKVLMKLN